MLTWLLVSRFFRPNVLANIAQPAHPKATALKKLHKQIRSCTVSKSRSQVPKFNGSPEDHCNEKIKTQEF
jgi:hypothetical protein